MHGPGTILGGNLDKSVSHLQVQMAGDLCGEREVFAEMLASLYGMLAVAVLCYGDVGELAP